MADAAPVGPEATESATPDRIEVRVDGQAQPLDPHAINTGFSERESATFVVRAPKEAGLRLLIDDAPLDQVEPAGAEETRWKWTPGFYAGEVRARLVEANGETAETYRLDVSPDTRKVGGDAFEEMVEAIYEFDSALLLGEAPAKRLMGAIGPTDDPLVLFERLRKRGDDIALALAAIRREPATILRPKRRFTPLREVRRADLQTLRAALHSHSALACLPIARERLAKPPKDDANGPEPIFDTPDVERTRDSPANRAALVMLRALIRRAASLPGKLAELDGMDDGINLAGQLAERTRILRELERRFRQVERRPPFSEVTRAEITAAGLNAVAAHPLYSRFWQISWAALRPGMYGVDRDDLLPLAPTWEIYERWCFVALAKKLEEWTPGFSWGIYGASGTDKRRAVGRRGHRAVTLRLQSTFSNTRGEPGANGWAVTRERRPDLLLTMEKKGRVTRFVLLDSKYTAKSLLNHVGDTTHKYQDGLRWGLKALRPSATLILAPTDRDAPWLAEEPFVREHRVGAIQLRPDSGPPDWLRDFLLERKDAGRASLGATSAIVGGDRDSSRVSTREELAAERFTSPIFDSPWYINEDRSTIGWLKQKSTKQKIRILSHHLVVAGTITAHNVAGVSDTPATSPVMRVIDGKVKWQQPMTDEAKLALLERLSAEAAFDLTVLGPYIGPDS